MDVGVGVSIVEEEEEEEEEEFPETGATADEEDGNGL